MGDSAQIVPGTRIGPYVIEGFAGNGSEGQVFLARDSLLGRHVVLKTSHEADGSEYTRRVEEARIAAKLAHPNAMNVLHAGRHHGVWFVVYEYLPGGTLHERVQRVGPLQPPLALRFLGDAAGALSHMHERGIVHCDVKPHNLLLTGDGRLKVADFGLSLERASGAVPPGTIVGTPAFAAPELWAGGSLGSAADVYSLGVCLYYMLAGRLPYAVADYTQLRQAHLHAEPRLPPGAPETVAEFMVSLLAKAPADRPTMQEAFAFATSYVRGASGSARKARAHRRKANTRLPQVVEPFADGALERGALAASAVGAERAVAGQLAAWLSEGIACVTLCADRPELGHDVLRLALSQRALRHCRRGHITLSGDKRLRTAFAPAAGRTPPLGTEWLDAVCGMPAQDSLEGGRVRVLELVAGQGLNDVQRADVQELIGACEPGSALVVCVVTEPRAGSQEGNVLRVPSQDVCDLEGLRQRVQAWAEAATRHRYRFSPDAIRVMREAVRCDAETDWRELARRAVLISAAAGATVVTSWAVLGARDSSAAMTRARDLIGEWGQPPKVWPTGDVLRWLRELRVKDHAQGKGIRAC